jgi:hypothetical protein
MRVPELRIFTGQVAVVLVVAVAMLVVIVVAMVAPITLAARSNE